MKQPATHFIEQVSSINIENRTNIFNFSMKEIKHLDYSLKISEKFKVNTIAIFKIYPKD